MDIEMFTKMIHDESSQTNPGLKQRIQMLCVGQNWKRIDYEILHPGQMIDFDLYCKQSKFLMIRQKPREQDRILNLQIIIFCELQSSLEVVNLNSMQDRNNDFSPIMLRGYRSKLHIMLIKLVPFIQTYFVQNRK